MTNRYQASLLRLSARSVRAISALLLGLFLALGLHSTALAQATCTDEGGQRVCAVAPGFGTLNEAIDSDTTATGERNDPNTIYMVEQDGIYILDGSIEHSGYHLRIYAEDGDGERPRLIPGVATGGEAARAFTPRGDLTIRGLYVTNQDELGGLVLRIVRVRENDVRITIEDSHLDRASQSAFRIDGTNVKIYIRNSIISNIGTPDSPENGRGFDDRGNDIDSLVVVNSTFYNLTSRVLRDGGGLINYAEFNHNTFYNIGRHGVSFGPTVKAKFTNNIAYNVGFYGNEASASETRHVVEIDSLTENPSTQEVTISNNNVYIDPAILAVYPDTVSAVPAYDETALAYLQENGTEETNLNEALNFVDPPAQPIDILTTYYADPAGEQEGWNTGVSEDAELTDPDVDVMPFDFAYNTGAASYSASTAGQPLGALTWWDIQLSTAGEETPGVPADITLQGNYPNPFNAATRIEFDLAAPAEVRVAIFDLLGRQVQVLSPRRLQAGSAHMIEIDASNLASGVYLYQLQVRTSDASTVRNGRMIVSK